MRTRGPSVCIVGAGAAGLSLAHVLARQACRVTLVEGGSDTPLPGVEDTYRVDLTGLPHRGVHEGRFRAWGGSTTRWGGQLWAWEEHEFRHRQYLQLEGWPIEYSDIAPYYERAFTLLGLQGTGLSRSQTIHERLPLPELDPELFLVKFSMWLPWGRRNLGRTVGASLKRDPNVTVHLGTAAVAIVMDSQGNASGVRVRTNDGTERVIAADVVVLAAGCIETTRLLFATFDGTSDGRYWLGRSFMDHLSVRVGQFHPTDTNEFARMFSPAFVGFVQHTPRILLRPDLLEREQLLGSFGHWEASLPPDSGLLALRRVLRSLQSGAGRPSVRDFRAIVAGLRDVASLAGGIAFHRRRYFARDAKIYLRVDTEQQPNSGSRITTTGQHDSLGLPRLSLDWCVSELERRTVLRTAELLGEEFDRRGMGKLEMQRDVFSSRSDWGEARSDSFHMMGGTRMARLSANGIVDTDCRVHGTRNLFVASTSVFPTGGMANPTLTLIALTLRLGDHLSGGR